MGNNAAKWRSILTNTLHTCNILLYNWPKQPLCQTIQLRSFTAIDEIDCNLLG